MRGARLPAVPGMVPAVALLAVAIFALAPVRQALAQRAGGDGPASQPALAGPASVPAQLEEDADARAAPALLPEAVPRIRSFDDARRWLQAEHGFTFGADYNFLYQNVTDSPGPNVAAGSVARLYGQWTLLNRGTANEGSLVFRVEYRSRTGTRIAPQDLGAGFGLAGATAVSFSDALWVLTNLYWAQSLFDNRVGLAVGIVDVTDWIDLHPLINNWRDFSNYGLLTNPTIAAPNQGLGGALRVLVTPQVYVMGGMADANGDPTRAGRAFDSFFGTGEHFRFAEIGWIKSWSDRYTDNVHLFAWQSDPRDQAGVKGGSGVAFSAHRLLWERWVPFLRAGFSNGGGAALERAASAGLGYRLRDGNDVVAFGAGWGQPSPSTTGGRRENQWTFEAYYRAQVTPRLEVTPAVQFIANPAYDRSVDSTWVFALRLRAAL